MTNENDRLTVVGDKGDSVNHWPWTQQQLTSRAVDGEFHEFMPGTTGSHAVVVKISNR